MGLTPSPRGSLIMLAVRMQGEKRGRQMRVLTSLGAEQVTAVQSTGHLGVGSGRQGGIQVPLDHPSPAHLNLLLAPHILLTAPPTPALFSSFQVPVGIAAEENKEGIPWRSRVRILGFHCQAPRFRPWLGAKTPRATRHSQKTRKIEKDNAPTLC